MIAARTQTVNFPRVRVRRHPGLSPDADLSLATFFSSWSVLEDRRQFFPARIFRPEETRREDHAKFGAALKGGSRRVRGEERRRDGLG